MNTLDSKWQRIKYMPGTGIGSDGQRVTGSQQHISIARDAAVQGMVLLKNEGKALPFFKGEKIAVFGKAQADYVKGGGGSGDVTSAYSRSLLEGLKIKEQEGKVCLFSPLSNFYSAYVDSQRSSGIQPGFAAEPEPDPQLFQSAREFTDTALITLCRFSAECRDRTAEPFDGDYYLSQEESRMIKSVLKLFDNVIVILNIGAVMDVAWIRDEPNIKAALLMWQAGMEGGLAAADLLCGDACPSGHLTDTFAESFDAYPSSAGFNASEDYVEYTEDIYVGYRYFETVPRRAKEVIYPFGFGLSYTDFSLEKVFSIPETDRIGIGCTVRNIGKTAGRQVVQIYCEAPQGKLGKPSRVLVGFSKTKILQPGEEEFLTISFSPDTFASYDDLGLIRKSAYVLEAGTYRFYAGFNVRDAVLTEVTYQVEQDTVWKQLSERCPAHQLRERMLADGSPEKLPSFSDFPRPDYKENIVPFDGCAPAENLWRAKYCVWLEPEGTFLKDVYVGKIILEEFISCLSEEQKICLLGGQPNRGPARTFGFGNIEEFGIPNAMTADGPAGLNFPADRGVNTTAFPVATLLACTWDPQVLFTVGQAAAEEAYENGIGTLLAPAINIHRNPLCGRNFEYYSEDPLVAGLLSAALVKGIQSVGIAASLKHFACNNKEGNRRESDSRVSERALREIYLKGFEICVKEANPWTVMTSYNIVNGIRTSENRDLISGILRGEWGYEGVVITDWYNHAEQYREINAGGDIKMGCGMPEETLKALQDGRLDHAAMEASVKRVLELLLKLA